MVTNIAPRRAKVTPEHQAEAARLRSIWESTEHETQAEFGEKYDVGNQSAVGQFLRGDAPLSFKAAQGFATGLKCAIADFSPRLAADIQKLSELSVANTDDQFVTVERADVQFSNGMGKLVYEVGTKAPLSFRLDYLRKLGISEKNAVVVDSEGRSNEPSIADGAVLLVNRAAQTIQNGKFYAFRAGDHLLVKRLYSQPDGSILAVPDNPDRDSFPERTYKESDSQDFELVGRVFWMASEL